MKLVFDSAKLWYPKSGEEDLSTARNSRPFSGLAHVERSFTSSFTHTVQPQILVLAHQSPPQSLLETLMISYLV